MGSNLDGDFLNEDGWSNLVVFENAALPLCTADLASADCLGKVTAMFMRDWKSKLSPRMAALLHQRGSLAKEQWDEAIDAARAITGKKHRSLANNSTTIAAFTAGVMHSWQVSSEDLAMFDDCKAVLDSASNYTSTVAQDSYTHAGHVSVFAMHARMNMCTLALYTLSLCLHSRYACMHEFVHACSVYILSKYAFARCTLG